MTSCLVTPCLNPTDPVAEQSRNDSDVQNSATNAAGSARHVYSETRRQ